MYSFHHLGVIPTKISKLTPGIGRDSTDRYSSLKILFIEPFKDKSSHLNDVFFFYRNVTHKISGQFPCE